MDPKSPSIKPNLCPKCQGDLYFYKDYYGPYLSHPMRRHGLPGRRRHAPTYQDHQGPDQGPRSQPLNQEQP